MKPFAPRLALTLVPVLSLSFAARASGQAAVVPEPATTSASTEVAVIEQARQRFAQATKLYKDGDFDAALIQFERAYELKPNYKVLYNIGQTYFQLRQYVEARDAMARYVAEGGDQIDPQRLAVVRQDLMDLEQRIAQLILTVNVPNAVVLVDGKKVGTTPLPGPIPVSEGQRTLSVEAPNRGVLHRLVRVAGGDRQTLHLEFEERMTSGARGPEAHPGPHLGAGFWATAAGAVALGAGAGITGYLALHAQADNRDQRKQVGVRRSELDDSDQRARVFALGTDVLAGAAILCAGVATIIWVSSPSRSAQVGLAVSPAAASLVGRF